MKIGFLGTGNIAHTVADALTGAPELELYAAASRNLEKARDFAAEKGFQKAYGSYEDLVRDPDVELIYVATPHSHHFEHMMLCLRHGKPVLSEKSFTMNADQAREIRDYAREHHILAAEAIWTRYLPSRSKINEILDGGRIGKPSVLTANLAYPVAHRRRIISPELAGGALLDVGVYGINFALMHFGKDITRLETSVQMTGSGVDGSETITLFYQDGRMASLTHSIYCRSDRHGTIYGDKGYLVVDNINNPQTVSVYDTGDRLLEQYDVASERHGYQYQFLECVRAIREGRWQTKSMPLEDSIEVMEVMDSIRRKWNLVYPQEHI